MTSNIFKCVLVRYDLTRLVIGSEGTLGVITEVTLRLQKIPQYSVVCTCWLLMNFYSAYCYTGLYSLPFHPEKVVHCSTLVSRNGCLLSKKFTKSHFPIWKNHILKVKYFCKEGTS